MHHEEKVIDGILCWRVTPDGEWTAFTPAEITRKYLEQLGRAANYHESLNQIGEILLNTP